MEWRGSSMLKVLHEIMPIKNLYFYSSLINSVFQITTCCHWNTLQAALQCKWLHSSHVIHCKWCMLECGGIFILSCIDLCYERCHIHVFSAGRNSAVHCRLSRVGVRLWMAWVDGTMLPALSLWHFHVERRSWKEERNKPTSSPRPARPAWSLVQKVAREASIPSVCVRVIGSVCHATLFLCWLMLHLSREGLEPFVWWVLLHFRWFCIIINYVKCYYMGFWGI